MTSYILPIFLILILTEILSKYVMLRKIFVILNFFALSQYAYLVFYSTQNFNDLFVFCTSILFSAGLASSQKQKQYRIGVMFPWLFGLGINSSSGINILIMIIAIFGILLLFSNKKMIIKTLDLFFSLKLSLFVLFLFIYSFSGVFYNDAIMKTITANLTFVVMFLVVGALGLNNLLENNEFKQKWIVSYFFKYLLLFCLPVLGFKFLSFFPVSKGDMSNNFIYVVDLFIILYFALEFKRTFSEGKHFLKLILKLVFVLYTLISFSIEQRLEIENFYPFFLLFYMLLFALVDGYSWERESIFKCNIITISCFIPLILSILVLDAGNANTSNYAWFMTLMISAIPLIYIPSYRKKMVFNL